MKRRAVLVGLGFMTLAALGTWLLWPSLLASRADPRINTDSFNMIKEGMTQEEVETVIGAPPGSYRAGRLAIIIDPAGGGTLMMAHLHRVESWSDRGGVINVAFDEDGRVCWKYLAPAIPVKQPNLFDRTRRRLGW